MNETEEKIKSLVKDIQSFDNTIKVLRNNRKERKAEIMRLLKTFIKDTEMLKDVKFSGFVDTPANRMTFGTFSVRTHEDRDWDLGFDLLRDVFKLFGHFAISVKLGEYKDTKTGALRGVFLGIDEFDLSFELSPDISVEDFRKIQKEYGFKVVLKNNETWLKSARERVEKYLYLNSLSIPE